MKKLLLSVLAITVSWQILDYLLHGVLLSSAYEETSSLWRPMEEMSMGMMVLISILVSGSFSYIYYKFVNNKNLKTALMYSLVYGFGAGVSFGYGSYMVMPIPYYMALTWFLGTIVEALVAGVIVGYLITDSE
ncbi:MAG: hypothetical protein K9J12_15245 [Melioribacteraceae bacterium]|nr:hypothetical protein [Melioribacteraceae bacterium]MCF8263109.1 hypothetical protein [Melioribacteraceae bacterium]MCF8413842.1 hypothetical protein [Melioribacteraceae bacterium]MCF8430559.1 hypothetical protein [Melioribacteraceae bacterium]